MGVQRLSNSGRSGYSYKSLIAGITPVPSVPTIGTATALTYESVSVEFTAPGAYSGSTYTATSSPGGFTASSATSPIVVTGLSGETEYTFTVTATNATGTSGASAASNSVTTPEEFSPTGSMDALAAVVVPSGGLSTVTFAGLPTGGQYTHLQIRTSGKMTITDAGYYGEIYMRFNGDSNANYTTHYLLGNGNGSGAVYSGGYTSRTGISATASIVGSNSSFNNMFSANIWDILDYANSTKIKSVRNFGGATTNANGSTQIGMNSGSWLNTDPISSITLYPNTTNFAEGTLISIYGVK